jgi:hypothetical protein
MATPDQQSGEEGMTLVDLVKIRGWHASEKRLKHIASYVCNFYLQWKPCSTLSSQDLTLVLYEPRTLPFVNAMLDQYSTWYHFDGKPKTASTGKNKKAKSNKSRD